ncbi:MAG TPA: hypothetical protein VFN55_02640 [Solirubrobacteraceae bacterium]|nr:hypothetical protein [Solirubrobacteraceae bacterium]
MKILALTADPITADDLRSALPGNVDLAELEVMVVAPALHESALRFWVSDADEAIARADRVRRDTVQQLGEDGVAAAADTGEGDLTEAAQDALATFPAERVVLFTHRQDEQRHGEDVDVQALSEQLGLPVDRAVVERGD